MRTRYVVLLLLVSLSIITYLDRICITVSASEMQRDLGISDQGWGFLLGAFLLAYGIFEIPTGALGDLIGQRKVLTRIVVWWSAFTMLTAVAMNYYALLATRFLFGVGEAGAYPNASGCIARWFPASERARAQGIVWGASRLGGALTPLLVVPLTAALGWKASFFVFGVVGLIWSAVWFVWFRDDPAQHPAVRPAELAEIGSHAGSHAHRNVPWGQLFRQSQLWLIVAMYFFYAWGAIFFMTWLPKYFENGRHLSRGEKAVCVALTFTMGALGNFSAGWASDRLSKRYGLQIGRKLIGVTCLIVSALLLVVAAFTPGKLVAAALLILCFGVMDGMLPCSWAICLDVGKRYAGAVSGAMNSAGQAGAYLSTVLYGYLIGWAGSYDFPLPFLAASLLISAVLFALINPNRPLIAEEIGVAIPKELACA